MQKQTIDLLMGRKVEDADAKTDGGQHRIVPGTAVPPPEGEVAGRSGYAYIHCPWDGAVNYVWVDDYTFIWYRCYHCSKLFKV